MSNEKFAELRLSGSAHGKRFAEQFPVGPIYDGLSPIQDVFATLGAGEILRVGSGVFMERVLRLLRAHKNVIGHPHPTNRSHPHTKPALSWNIAASYYFQNPHIALTAHLTFLMPNFMDFERRDGTYSNQHVVMFSNTNHQQTNDLGIEAFVESFLAAHADPSSDA